ncbi:hypothetical protein RRG08_045251 [Elysia crispata]|uniref:Uncharacterized protein n=1 Tax=Elysia crispata TaxID=231223 RepID=A0AAE1DRD7_9GAST|nr:hypothetical protein RRG08_045251 [Elysia crispata]
MAVLVLIKGRAYKMMAPSVVLNREEPRTACHWEPARTSLNSSTIFSEPSKRISAAKVGLTPGAMLDITDNKQPWKRWFCANQDRCLLKAHGDSQKSSMPA